MHSFIEGALQFFARLLCGFRKNVQNAIVNICDENGAHAFDDTTTTLDGAHGCVYNTHRRHGINKYYSATSPPIHQCNDFMNNLVLFCFWFSIFYPSNVWTSLKSYTFFECHLSIIHIRHLRFINKIQWIKYFEIIVNLLSINKSRKHYYCIENYHTESSKNKKIIRSKINWYQEES